MSASTEGIAPNAKRLLLAGFLAIFAAGVGFAIRGGIIYHWGTDFGFSGAQIGSLSATGLSGFFFGVIIGGVVCDKIGYGKLVCVAFLLHIASAIVTYSASVGDGSELAKLSAYKVLYTSMFLFALANGTLEAVANPLVATLFPKNRTHYLNILHASWPAGLVVGAVLCWVLDEHYSIGWRTQLALYLIPTVLYGIMFFGQKFPRSEAAEKGASTGEMFKDVGILGSLVIAAVLALFMGDFLKLFGMDAETAKWTGWGIGFALVVAIGALTKFSMGSLLLFVLFVTHALIGSVELGTDTWSQYITGNLFTTSIGKYLFLWTSAVMFALRFCAHFIETRLKLSPVGLLLVCSITAFVGLQLASRMDTLVMAFLAMGIYAVGKTFFWPTMLAVASDRYPRTGAIAISIMGGIGMLSVGTLGGPGLGYLKDRFAGQELETKNPTLYSQVKSTTGSQFLNLDFTTVFGIDGKKLGETGDKLKAARTDIEKSGGDVKLAADKLTPDERTILDASTAGDRKVLFWDSFIPATMAVIYILIFLYFKSIGGYKVLKLEDEIAAEKH